MSREPVSVSESSIDAHLALDEARYERSRRVHLMALLSVPVVVLTLWPTLFSEVGRRAVVTFWAFSAFAVVLAGVAEWRLVRRLSPSAGSPRQAR